MLRGKRILLAEDNDWIAAELIQTIVECHGIALGPAATNISALALTDEHPDGAILDGNLLDGPITPVARAVCDNTVPLVVFTGLGFPADLQRSHPDIPVILKPSPYETVIHVIAERIQSCLLPRTRVGNVLGTHLIPPQRLGIQHYRTTKSVGFGICQKDPLGHPNQGPQRL